MLIAILVLLGLAGAIWYFARKQAQAIVTLTQEDVVVPTQEQKEAELKQAQEDALKTVKESTKKVKTMIEKIDNVLANNVEASIPQEVANELSSIEKLQDELANAQAAAATQAAVPTPVPVEETAPKPPKKKRRYYPKKK
jgi:TolA-binding protein